MPALKVFVSSTCYDLSDTRDGLRKFIISLGHDPIMSDYSDVLYDPRLHTHTSCIDEVCNCDMLVLVIGGRFGGKASKEALSKIDFERLKSEIKLDRLQKENCSITHLEVLKAIERKIPVYTFIQKDVYNFHNLYETNKDNPLINENDIKYPPIEKQETAKYIFEFINVVRRRSHGNNIFTFEKETEIEDILKKQWSRYFQKLLNEQHFRTNNENPSDLEKKVNQLEEVVWKLIKEIPNNIEYRKIPEKKHRRILWVDDYPQNNEIIRRLFENHNIHFDIALTTKQGLQLYKSELYDIVITDMGRGDESYAGLTLIRELNRLCCQIPIIVYCSRSAMQKYGNEAMRLGAYKVTNGISSIISLIAEVYGLNEHGL